MNDRKPGYDKPKPLNPDTQQSPWKTFLKWAVYIGSFLIVVGLLGELLHSQSGSPSSDASQEDLAALSSNTEPYDEMAYLEELFDNIEVILINMEQLDMMVNDDDLFSVRWIDEAQVRIDRVDDAMNNLEALDGPHQYYRARMHLNRALDEYDQSLHEFIWWVETRERNYLKSFYHHHSEARDHMKDVLDTVENMH